MNTEVEDIVARVRGFVRPRSDILLFKFRDLNENLTRIFSNRQIYFSSPEKLNDPFDCQHDLLKSLERSASRKDAHRQDLLESLLQHNKELIRLEEEAKNSGICSFSNEILNPLLWSHYADESRGVCLVFKFPQEFVQRIPDVLNLEDVIYDDSGLSRWLWMDAHRYLQVMPQGNGLPKAFLSKLLTILLSTKGKSWRYEQETRIIRSKPGSIEIKPEFIKGVCFGMQTPKPQREKIMALASQNGFRCRYFQLNRSDTDFGVSVGCYDDDETKDVDLLSEISGHPPAIKLHELIKRDMIRESLNSSPGQ